MHPTRVLCMAAKKKSKKAKNIAVKLLSTAGTGYSYRTTKNPINVPDKLVLKKYDPVVQRHVLFTETKMSSGRKR